MKTLRKYLSLLVVSLLVGAGFFLLWRNISPALDLERNKPFVLARGADPAGLAKALVDSGFVSDARDAACISEHIFRQLSNSKSGRIENLGSLQKRPFLIEADSAEVYGGEMLQRRVRVSRSRLGVTDTLEKVFPICNTSEFVASGDSTVRMRLRVREVNEKYKSGGGIAAKIKGAFYKIFRRDYYKPVPDVLVRIDEYDEQHLTGQVIGYVKTDAKGEVRVFGKIGHYYSLLPVQKGYEFGAPVGVTGEKGLRKKHNFEKFRTPHTIRLLDGRTYSRIKESGQIAVRTPMEFRETFLTCILVFFLLWWLFFVLLDVADRNRIKPSDRLIPLILMLLTGIDIIAMFSIVDPLVDTLLAVPMMQGLAAGLVLMYLLSFIPVNTGSDPILPLVRWLSLPVKRKVQWMQAKYREHHSARKFRNFLHYCLYLLGLLLTVVLIPLEWILMLCCLPFRAAKYQLPKGSGYLLVLLFLVVLLYFFGDGPEGSGTRVNLFFFQPSELNKYLAVTFMALFFAANGRRIITFSERLDKTNFRLQLKTVLFIGIAILLILVLYMSVLSDMGPALVLIVTFVFLYSLARRDIGMLFLGIVTFAGLMFLAGYLAPGSVRVKAVTALFWLFAWIIAGYVAKKKIFESAIFFNLLVSAFIFGGSIMGAVGMDSVARRLNDRIAVTASVWDNDALRGGDQVANGIWSLATGGLTGQGPGNGSPNLVPAFHTDMIFTSIGEEMGWGVLALVVLSFIILLYRGFIISYRSGKTFPFYLAAGITLVTGVQFFTIVLGSLGYIPLTGVAAPFLSFGRTSLILNLAAIGFMLSISRSTATENQRREIRKYGNVVAVGIETFIALGLLVLGILFNYMVLSRDKYLVLPAYVCTPQGLKHQEYNPRIDKLMGRLNAGSIYDRNNEVLASGSTAEGGRQYPYGAHLFFMLGDVNTNTLQSLDYGFMAEYRYRSDLRGFSTRISGEKGQVTLSSSWKATPFFHAVKITGEETVYDYSDPMLLQMLKEGRHSKSVEAWNAETRQRDLHLTVDAKLQKMLQEEMAESPLLTSAKRPKLRASVVILDAEKGDLLTSANYPLPDQDVLREFLNTKQSYQTYEKTRENPVLTECDLGLTFRTAPGSTAKIMSAMSAFKKNGTRAADISYQIRHSINSHDTKMKVRMKYAIVNSHNTYFVYLVNKAKLYTELGDTYAAVGARVREDYDDRTYYPTYLFYPEEFTPALSEAFFAHIRDRQEKVPKEFDRFFSGRGGKINSYRWGWAWGQGSLEASPLNMARVASIPANGGALAQTRFVETDTTVSRPILKPEEAQLLREFMIAEATKPGRHFPADSIGGKTGTPQRVADYLGLDADGNEKTCNDAWYICFVDVKETAKNGVGVKKMAIAVRLERSVQNSGLAVEFVKEVVLKTLPKAGYECEDISVSENLTI